ncbi:uncharacterized protein LOC143279408 [Babylonia areolata]|uniref:uncharacterized protein LOC143279408 n=1 Tax=Babylonia areolata TaxID=304850 RepID=UPI003FD652D6
MSKLFVFFVAFFTVALTIEHASGAAMTAHSAEQEEAGGRGEDRKREAAAAKPLRARRQAATGPDSYLPLDDAYLLLLQQQLQQQQPLLRAAPVKRQWCRRGMAYNPALGTCTFSVAAMRGRGRNYRRH